MSCYISLLKKLNDFVGGDFLNGIVKNAISSTSNVTNNRNAVLYLCIIAGCLWLIFDNFYGKHYISNFSKNITSGSLSSSSSSSSNEITDTVNDVADVVNPMDNVVSAGKSVKKAIDSFVDKVQKK